MAVKVFGAAIKTSDDYIKELYDIAQCNFPLEISVVGGKIANISYQTEWQEGFTTPVENKKGDVVDYKPSYEQKSLNKDQIRNIDEYITKNLAA